VFRRNQNVPPATSTGTVGAQTRRTPAG